MCPASPSTPRSPQLRLSGPILRCGLAPPISTQRRRPIGTIPGTGCLVFPPTGFSGTCACPSTRSRPAASSWCACSHPAASAADPLPALPVTALPCSVRSARYPRLVTPDKAAKPVDRLHPIKIVRALRAQDVQQAQRQHHLPVGPALVPHYTLRQIPKRSAQRRRTEPQHNAAARRRIGRRVRKMVPHRERGIRDHSPFVQDRICHIPCNPLPVKDQRGTLIILCRG